MRIIASTDNKYLGKEIPAANKGDIIQLGDFLFEVQKVTVLEDGLISFINSNYQLQCEE